MAIFDEPSRQPLPQPTFEDVKHSVGKGLASMIPFVGGAGSELIGLLSSPVAQRRDDWFEDLARRLHDLEGRVAGFKFDDLANNEQFVSATLQATLAVIRTNQQEKLEALRNAVLNVALGKEMNVDHQQQFLALVDRYTELHLTLLRYFASPSNYHHARGEPIPTVPLGADIVASEHILKSMPGLVKQATLSSQDGKAASIQFVELIISDLIANQLIKLVRVGEVWTMPHVYGPNSEISAATTHLGNNFLTFIRAPPKPEG